MSYFKTCPHCGANLDPGEVCDCREKEKPPAGAANTDEGKVDTSDQTVPSPMIPRFEGGRKMKYPIDAEKYISAMRQEFGENKAAEEAHRAIIPVVNEAYAAGLHGEGGYPLEVGAELQAFAEASGRPLEHIQANKLLPPLIRWVNSAYAQGQQETAV